MAIEQYLQQDQTYVQTDVAINTHPDRSPVATLGYIFTREGSDGVKAVFKELGLPQDVAIVPDATFFAQLSSTQVDSFIKNYGALVLGISVQAIERTIFQGSFNLADFYTDHNNAIVGTPLHKLEFIGEDTELLSREQLDNMINYIIVTTDKTLTSFFDLPAFRLLPQTLQDALISSGALPHINNSIGRLFAQRAKWVIKNPE